MQPPKKVSKYLKKPSSVDDTLPPRAFAQQVGQTDAAAHDDVMLHSLTPVNVLEKIRNDIISVLGIQADFSGKFSKLETLLIDHLEKIVRKGQCPSILVKERPLIEAMLCLKKFYEHESVLIRPDDHTQSEAISVPVFPALYKYAKDAAFCEQRVRDLRQQRGLNPTEKKKVEAEIRQLKDRKDHCLIYYQKILFTDAEMLASSGRQRQLSIYGKRVTLEDLLQFVKKGGRLDQARSKAAPKSRPQDNTQDMSVSIGSTSTETLGSFDQTNSLDEVLDWRQIRSDSD